MNDPILVAVRQTIGQITVEGMAFWATLADLAPMTYRGERIAERLEVNPTTLVSRFERAGLPSPKRLLTGYRIVLAARMFEADDRRTVSTVAYRIGFCSPQSFIRHLRKYRGVTGGQLARSTERAELDHYLATLILPTSERWEGFMPLTGALHRRPMAVAE